jgi:hypothetical protein
MQRDPAVQPCLATNGSFPIRRTRTADPDRSIRFLHTGRSAEPIFCKLECYKAAFVDLTQPANTGHLFVPALLSFQVSGEPERTANPRRAPDANLAS